MSIIFSLVFAFLAFSGIIIAMQAVTAKPRQDLIAERLAQYRDHNLTLDEIELSLPFSERFIKPVLERLRSLLTARMAKNRQIVVQNKINLAGRPYALSVNGFEVVKVIVGIVIALVALGLAGVMGVTSLPLKGAALGLGFVLGRFLPDVWLNNKIKGRQKELRLALPNALDLLTISVEAGLGAAHLHPGADPVGTARCRYRESTPHPVGRDAAPPPSAGGRAGRAGSAQNALPDDRLHLPNAIYRLDGACCNHYHSHFSTQVGQLHGDPTGRVRRPAARGALAQNSIALVCSHERHTAPALFRPKGRLALRARTSAIKSRRDT